MSHQLRRWRGGPFGWAALLLLSTAGCRAEELTTRSDASHGKDATPDYERLFQTDSVPALTIRLEPGVAQEMEDDLRISLFEEVEPAWFSAIIAFDDREWSHVGVRYRGNGTIEDLRGQGSKKFPLRLTFDRFESEFPETKNQRFYGFRKLVLSTSSRDPSLVREVLASEALLAAGVKAPRASFVRVFVDHGDGAFYQGLYSLIEDVDDDAMQGAQLGGVNGNLYKPEGEGARLVELDEASLFPKGGVLDDFSDVRRLVDALAAEQDTPSKWRETLEGAFDVEGFINYLATNVVLGNHDAYGCKPENYFLYGSPSQDGRLAFIPWDFDRSFSPVLHQCGKEHLEKEDPLLTTTSEGWPLIHRVLSDEEYREEFELALARVSSGPLAAEHLTERATRLHSLIEPYVIGEDGELEGYQTHVDPDDFEEGLQSLVKAIEARGELVDSVVE